MNKMIEDKITSPNANESEIMEYCAILVIKNVNPRYLKAHEIRIGEYDHFHFLAKKSGKWFIYQNVGRDLSEREYESLKKYVKTWGGGDSIECNNGILRMEVPPFSWAFFDKVNEIPGCRLTPNTFQNQGDAYISIEFPFSKIQEVSRVIMDFMGEESLFRKEIIYFGEQNAGIPQILKVYQDFGNSLEDFTIIETLWDTTNENIEKQNMGVFQNSGTFAPKHFINLERDKLIARLDSLNIQGEAEYTIIDERKRIVEFDIKSRFFSDFYNEVVERYSGPIFLSLKINREGVHSYYIIEKDVQQLFINGVNSHWKRPARKNHKNYILNVTTLDKWIAER